MEAAQGTPRAEAPSMTAAMGGAAKTATPCGNPCESCARRATCPALAMMASAHEGGRA